MDILELQYNSMTIDLEIEKKDNGNHYLLTLKDTQIQTTYRLLDGEIEDLMKGTNEFLKRVKFLKRLKEKIQ